MSTPIPTSDLESSRKRKKPQPSRTNPPAKSKISLGEYELKKRLGQGGMGEVFLAIQSSLQRKVAVKVLSKELSNVPMCVERFMNEARSMARLDHPNIVDVYSVGTEKGRHYAAIEYIDGRSVQDWMDERGALSVSDALYIFKECLYGLSHAHEKNVIHRDIKPDNILITAKGDVKLADFGLAKAIDDDLSMTKSGHGLGTPIYMPPEQERNAKYADKRSDLYAIGATLYHMLTNEIPFTGETAAEISTAKERGHFKSARLINSKVPEKLDLIIHKLLAKKPEHRYQDCSDVFFDLERIPVEADHISFIEGSSRTPVSFSRKTVSGSVRQKLPETVVPRTSKEDAERNSKENGKAPQGDWYVRHTNESGQLQISMLSTMQIQKAVKGGTLDPKARVKKSPRHQFLPLAQFPEFANIVQARLTQDEADKRSEKIRDIYTKIDKQDRRRKKWRWLSRLKEGTLGWISLLIYLGLIAAIGYGCVLGFPVIYKMAAGYFNL